MGKFVVRETKTGTKFDLKASNGQVIGTSEVYASKSACHHGIESVKANVVVAKFEDHTVENFEKVTNPKFEVFLDKAGEYRFRLKAKNGEIILESEGYTTKPNCLNGIESVKNNAPIANVEEVKSE